MDMQWLQSSVGTFACSTALIGSKIVARGSDREGAYSTKADDVGLALVSLMQFRNTKVELIQCHSSVELKQGISLR